MNQLVSTGATLFEHEWLPAGAPRAAIAIAHGYGEHIGRYEHVGKAFADAGYAVFGCDLRGHGKSEGTRGYIERFDDYLDDLDALIGKARSSGLPIYLLAHSMGALVATHYVGRRDGDLAGLVLSAPFYRLKLAVPKIKIYVGKAASTLLPKLAIPSGLKGADVSRDPAIAAAYDSDPLNNKSARARWFTETMAAQAELESIVPRIRIPLLVLHGTGDRIADPARTEELYPLFGSTDKTLGMLPEQFHEILNEPEADRKKTIARILDWINSHVGRAAARSAV